LTGSVHATKEQDEAWVVASKEIGLEVNADKITYTVMPRDRNAGRSHRRKIDNSTLRRGGKVQVFGNNLIKSKFYSRTN
jgi:hypothetical protein